MLKNSKSPKVSQSRKSPKNQATPFLDRIYNILLLALAPLLYFSYFPTIALGQTDSMNLEFSVPLLWLVLFDLAGIVLLFKYRPTLDFHKNWPWLLLPLYLTVTVVWSLNPLRGFLTAGIFWLIYLAIFCFFALRPHVKSSANLAHLFWRIFFISSLVACAWCWFQSFLDLAGLAPAITQMCPGCTSVMFGFPHPNGFAIEPQFMGNLLLAPTLLAAWFSYDRKKYLFVFFALYATLFLTFSRGAIYACTLALVLLTILKIIQTKSARPLWQWLVVFFAFIFTLNAQGIMAAVGPTDETYASSTAKIVHQLSLGQIDFRSAVAPENALAPEIAPESESVAVSETASSNNNTDSYEQGEAVFDGYVAESTDTRVSLTNSALNVWRANFNLMIYGVGLGGAGQALYDYQETSSPKEIVQNEYASLLLETGLLGIILAVFTLYLVCRRIYESPLRLPLYALLFAYAITLFFFSGLPNALQIYLTPALILLFSDGKSSSRKPPRRVAYKIPARSRAHSRK